MTFDDDEGMRLDEYVRQTLLAVVGGVMSAQEDERCGEYFGRAPLGSAEHLNLTRDAQENTIALVKFDLATTVESRKQGGGAVGVKVVSLFKAEADGKGETASSLVSRISFVVPISIPKPDKQRAADDARRRQQSAAIRGRNGGGWAA